MVEMEIAEANVHEWAKLLLDDCATEEVAGQAYTEVEDFGDIERSWAVYYFAFHFIRQRFLAETKPTAGLAGGFDIIHESHLGDDDALAACKKLGAAIA